MSKNLSETALLQRFNTALLKAIRTVGRFVRKACMLIIVYVGEQKR